jgi:transposase
LGNSDFADNVGPLDKVFDSVVALINIFMVIGMRKSLVQHYNSVEPIGLKLNELLTIVLGVVYFQFHFSNIAAWKKTRTGTVPVQAGAPLSPAS